MKKQHLIIGLIIGVALLSSCDNETVEPKAQEPDQEEQIIAEEVQPVILTKELQARVIERANNFSYNLFNAVYNDLDNLSEKNIFVSPLSVSMAMSMIANGAVGETRDEILKALGYDDLTTLDGFNLMSAKLIETLPNVDPKVNFNIANALWVNSAYSIKESYVDKVSSYYNATVDNLDFSVIESADVVNNWVYENTNGLIERIVNSLDSSSRLMLANALYFKGKWLYRDFEDRDMQFTDYRGNIKEVEAMHGFDRFLYNSNDKCAIVTLALGDDKYRYTAILPNEGVSITDAVASVTDQFIDEATNQLVSFESPTFEFRNELDITDYLLALGINRTFGEMADFSEITDASIFYINKILHYSSINLNTGGIEAAAVTATESASFAGDLGSLPEYQKFYLNRPFAFLLREESTGAIVFVGAVNQL